jgi:malate synthase
VTAPFKAPWYVDLLNINLDNVDLQAARRRIAQYMDTFARSGVRMTENLDFET